MRLAPTINPGPSDRSPDKKWTASIKDHNVFVHREGEAAAIKFSDDGKDGLSYGRLNGPPIQNARRLANRAGRAKGSLPRPVFAPRRRPRKACGRGPIRCLATSSTPTSSTCSISTPRRRPSPRSIRVDFDSPRLRWGKDGRHFTLEKTDRGHQRFRLIEVDSRTGESRDLIDEKTNTFIWTAHREALNVNTVTWLDSTDE